MSPLDGTYNIQTNGNVSSLKWPCPTTYYAGGTAGHPDPTWTIHKCRYLPIRRPFLHCSVMDWEEKVVSRIHESISSKKQRSRLWVRRRQISTSKVRNYAARVILRNASGYSLRPYLRWRCIMRGHCAIGCIRFNKTNILSRSVITIRWAGHRMTGR